MFARGILRASLVSVDTSALMSVAYLSKTNLGPSSAIYAIDGSGARVGLQSTSASLKLFPVEDHPARQREFQTPQEGAVVFTAVLALAVLSPGVASAVTIVIVTSVQQRATVVTTCTHATAVAEGSDDRKTYTATNAYSYKLDFNFNYYLLSPLFLGRRGRATGSW